MPRSKLTLIRKRKRSPTPSPQETVSSDSDYTSTTEICQEEKLKKACRRQLSDTFVLQPPTKMLARRRNAAALATIWKPVVAEQTSWAAESADYNNEHHFVDSGYLSHGQKSASISPLSTRGSSTSAPAIPEHTASSSSSLLPHATATNSAPNSAREYSVKMHTASERIFQQKYVNKHFTHNPREARKALEPVMRKALDLPEDKENVDKFYLILNFKKGTIRGEHLKRRKRIIDMNARRWEGDDYFSCRAPAGA